MGFEGYPKTNQFRQKLPAVGNFLTKGVGSSALGGMGRDIGADLRAATRASGPWLGQNGYIRIASYAVPGPNSIAPHPHPNGEWYYYTRPSYAGNDPYLIRGYITVSDVHDTYDTTGSPLDMAITNGDQFRIWLAVGGNSFQVYDEDLTPLHSTTLGTAISKVVAVGNSIVTSSSTSLYACSQDWDGVAALASEAFTGSLNAVTINGTHLWVSGNHPTYGQGLHVWDMKDGPTFTNYLGTIPGVSVSATQENFISDGTYIWWFASNQIYRVHVLGFDGTGEVESFTVDEATGDLTGILYDGLYLRVGAASSGTTPPYYIHSVDPMTGKTVHGKVYPEGTYSMKIIRARHFGHGVVSHSRSAGTFSYGCLAVAPHGIWQDASIWKNSGDLSVYRRGGYEIDGSSVTSVNLDIDIPPPTLVVSVTGSISSAVSISTSNRSVHVGLLIYNNGTDSGGSVSFGATSIPFGTGILVGPSADYTI